MNFEIIIIYSGNSDNSKYLFLEHTNQITYRISKADNVIYNDMNKICKCDFERCKISNDPRSRFSLSNQATSSKDIYTSVRSGHYAVKHLFKTANSDFNQVNIIFIPNIITVI
jgi:hypothetical protein